MSELQTFKELILSAQTAHTHLWHMRILKYCNMNWLIQFETETSTFLDRFLWLENIKKTVAIYANKMSAATEIRCPQCNSLYVAPSPEDKNRLECKECGTLFWKINCWVITHQIINFQWFKLVGQIEIGRANMIEELLCQGSSILLWQHNEQLGI